MWIRILAPLALIVFAIGPATAASNQPACTEYCYDPIPNPGSGTDPSTGGGSVSPPTGGNSQSGPDGTAPGGVVGSSAADLAERLGIVSESSGSGTGGQTFDSTAGDSTFPSVDANQSESSSSSASSAALILMLGLSGAIVLGFAYRKRLRGGRVDVGAAARLGAFAAVVIVLLALGSGSALASKPSAPKGFFGVMSLEAIANTDAQRMAAGGVESYRMPFGWDLIQPEPQAGYSWGSIDPSVEAAARSGVRVLPILYGTPSGFANKSTKLPIKTSKQRQGWASFLRAVIRRYGRHGEFWSENPGVPKLPIRTWQIWNEANFFYFATPVSPRNYVNLLKLSHRVITREDPRAKIMLSGLYGSPRETRGRAMKSARFIDKIYRMGGRPYFDSVAVHPYTPSTGQLRLLLKQVRKTLIKHRARKTPMHVTEIGWGSDSATVFGMGNRTRQAKQLTSGYNLMLKMRRYLNLRSVYWFAWKDISRNADTCNFCYSSGLFQAGSKLKPKPAWKSFVRVVKRSRR